MIDLDANASTLEQYKRALYFQVSKETLEWVAIVSNYSDARSR